MFGPNGTGPEPEVVAEEDVEILDIDLILQSMFLRLMKRV